MLRLLWQICDIIGQFFIVANGQTLKNLNISSHWLHSNLKENPNEKTPPTMTKEEEAEKREERTFLKIGLFDLKMIVIASVAMIFSIICGKLTRLSDDENSFWVYDVFVILVKD